MPLRRGGFCHIAPGKSPLFFNLLAADADMPANLATSRTPFPLANPCLAAAALVTGMGGLPNLTRPFTGKRPACDVLHPRVVELS
jgi:hypothetical protein